MFLSQKKKGARKAKEEGEIERSLLISATKRRGGGRKKKRRGGEKKEAPLFPSVPLPN